MYHQGSRWEVSARVVPLLVAVADDRGTADRPRVVNLIRLVGIGDLTDEALPFDAEEAYPPVDEAMRDRIRDLMPAFYDEDIDDEDTGVADAAARMWQADAFDATAQHTDTFRHWLTDDDTEVAARAAELLAWFPATSDIIDSLQAIPTDDLRAAVRASANLTLGHCSTNEVRIDSHLRAQLDADPPLVRLSAAVALARRARNAMPEEARDILLSTSNARIAETIPGWRRPLSGFIALATQSWLPTSPGRQ